MLEGDVNRVQSYGARFAGVVSPGEALKASLRKGDDRLAGTIAAPPRDDAVALSGVEQVPA